MANSQHYKLLNLSSYLSNTKNGIVDTGWFVENMDIFFTIVIDGVFLIQMIKMIFNSYMSPCLSPIKHDTTHNNTSRII